MERNDKIVIATLAVAGFVALIAWQLMVSYRGNAEFAERMHGLMERVPLRIPAAEGYERDESDEGGA